MWYNDRNVWHNILTYPNWFLCRIHFQCMSTYRDFFLIRPSFVYRSSPIIQVQSLPARPQTTIKNRKDEQGGRNTFGRLNLKTDEKTRKRKQGGQNFWKPEEVQWCACASVIRAILFQSLVSENRMLWSNSVMSREHSKTAAALLSRETSRMSASWILPVSEKICFHFF